MSTLTLTKDLVNVAGASEVALSGYDPVAFFTDGQPVNGNFEITATHCGATYYFASEEHKELFAQDPDKYAPQNGGFCTFGVSVGALFPVDINTGQVYNGKLYLNLNPDILEMFKKDMDGNIAKAAKNWPGLVEKNAK
jgi:YHS domain-containing protein